MTKLARRLVALLCAAFISHCAAEGPSDRPALDFKVPAFEITGETLAEAISKLSAKSIPNLHLGLEMILKDKESERLDRSIVFSLTVRDRTLRELLDLLCSSDFRYAWSSDGESVNVYPRDRVDDSEYFLNRRIERLSVQNILDPDEVFGPLYKMFPQEPMGYSGFGDNAYRKPLTAVFENMTVRQLLNRVAEHLGPQSIWVMHGVKNDPFFTIGRGTLQIGRAHV